MDIKTYVIGELLSIRTTSRKIHHFWETFTDQETSHKPLTGFFGERLRKIRKGQRGFNVNEREKESGE